MSQTRCPMCRAPEMESLERLAVADLDYVYRRQLNIRVRAEFHDCKELTFFRCLNCDLRFFWPMHTGSAKFYGELHHRDWYYLQEKSEYLSARQWLKRGGSVLDVGCGYGFFSAHVSAVEGSQFTGLELTETAAQSAAARGLNVRCESVEQHAVQWPEHYDVVSSFQVLEHVSEIQSFIEASLACLRPGGLLIYSVPSADSFVGDVNNGVLNLPPHHVSWWTDEALRNLATLFQLELVELWHEPLDAIHFKTYAFSRAVKAVKRMVGQRRKLIDRSPQHKLVSLLALPAALWHFLCARLVAERVSGHSVTAVYRKCEQSTSVK